MPLGKYHCDYCDKEFQDTPAARKRHLQGVYHQRAKALWYDSLRYGNQVPDPESIGKKGVCNHFIRTGSCQYGDSCKYYHPRQNVQNLGAEKISGLNFTEVQSQSLGGSQIFSSSSFPGNTMGDNIGTSWGNLPPSLRPPPESGYPPLPFIDWG